MSITGLQIATVAFSVFMMYISYIYYRKRYFNVYLLLVWLLIFAALMVVTVFPTLLNPFQRILNIARLFDLFIFLAILFLTILTFMNFLHLQKLSKKMDKFIQNDALKEKLR